jgi:hypothetical protein
MIRSDPPPPFPLSKFLDPCLAMIACMVLNGRVGHIFHLSIEYMYYCCFAGDRILLLLCCMVIEYYCCFAGDRIQLLLLLLLCL